MALSYSKLTRLTNLGVALCCHCMELFFCDAEGVREEEIDDNLVE